MHGCLCYNHCSPKDNNILVSENRSRIVKITCIFHFACYRERLVYGEVLMLSRDLGIFPKHTPSSHVPHETQSEATVLAFNFLYHNITYLLNIRILLKIRERAFYAANLQTLHILICKKNPKLFVFTLWNFRSDCSDNTTPVVTAVLVLKSTSAQRQLWFTV